MLTLALLPAFIPSLTSPVFQEPITPVAAQVALTDGAPGATAPKTGDEVAVMDTSMGRIVLKFFPDKAPGHTKNFIDLSKKGFYDGTKFHRVIKGFMIQGGDPLTKDDAKKDLWGTGGPGYEIKAEFNDIPHTPGIISMARSQDPDSAGSQFFIVHKAANFLDNQYTVFGQVVDGMKVVNMIAESPVKAGGESAPSVPVTPVVIEKVEIKTWPLN